MVKVGFICEGLTEVELVSSDSFNTYLNSLNLEVVNVINAGSSSMLVATKRIAFVKSLENKGAQFILILTDLDTSTSLDDVYNKIEPLSNEVLIIAVKEIEAWFLANTATMRVLLNKSDFFHEYPELESEPFEIINKLLVEYTQRGIGSNSKRTSGKVKLIKRLISLGFSIQDSASHPNCPSAKYFVEKLSLLSSN
jgi:hypothetical protein